VWLTAWATPQSFPSPLGQAVVRGARHPKARAAPRRRATMSLRRQNSKQGRFNHSQHIDFKACFEIYDEDGDGKLDTDDTIKALRALGKIITQEEVDDIVMDLDCDHDSECDYAQYCVLIDKVQNKGVTRRQLQEAFKALDEDGNGEVTTAELKRTLTAVGEPLTDEEVADFMQHADKNGDGVVDYMEFSNMMLGKTRRRMSLFGDPRKPKSSVA